MMKKSLCVMLISVLCFGSIAPISAQEIANNQMNFSNEESISTTVYNGDQEQFGIIGVELIESQDTKKVDKNKIQEHKQNDINNILTISDEFIDYLQDIKERNPKLSDEKLIRLIDETLSLENDIMVKSIIYPSGWSNLTTAEKIFIVANPLLVNPIQLAVNDANYCTKQYYGHNLVGDPSDAYRHAVWNALMAKYIGAITSKSTGISKAAAFATAHEDYPSSVLQEKSKNSNGVLDGYTLLDHKDMDLYNNKKGRDIFDLNSTLVSTALAKKVYDNRNSLRYLYTY
ncbi:hypothetical protein Amet_4677 [Alkaliphilus metalliredigens QYMF]|uniref:DUF6973 domain-containing protein n=1 Tax=Alkaliphilus metalliredigens (strain QYMF) TaxID=293826 RepID=A6TX27_ALKMQ|nr:hypothetical protein [Alkaliphilus metalliredigens]ABR50745.1 hypothetical protein Amet_4677 [Alkaliphilus metalliredigens QYMF]